MVVKSLEPRDIARMSALKGVAIPVFHLIKDYMRDNTHIKGVKTINCVMVGGGAGDIMCSTMAVDYIIKNSPWLNLLVWAPDYLVDFVKNVLPNAVVRGISEGAKKFDDKKLGISTKWSGQHTALRTNPVKYAFHVLADYSPKTEEMNYLSVNFDNINTESFNLPEKYVVLQGAHAEVVKTMPAATFNDIKEYCFAMGYEVVVLGNTKNSVGLKDAYRTANVASNYNLEGTIDLLNKTSILESIKIVQNSKALVCMDGGLMHMGGFTDTPIVAGFTFASPEILMPIRNNQQGYNVFPVVPDEDLKCSFCQSRMTLYFGHDFRSCVYGPKDYSCTKQMTSIKFIEQLERII